MLIKKGRNSIQVVIQIEIYKHEYIRFGTDLKLAVRLI